MRSLGIDPQSVTGSGPGGRIVERTDRRARARTGGPSRNAGRATPRATSAAPIGTSTMRRAIAHFTTLSAAVPQFQLRAEVDVTALTVLREQLLPRIEGDTRRSS